MALSCIIFLLYYCLSALTLSQLQACNFRSLSNTANFRCFIKTPSTAHYALYVAPLVICLLINTVVFVQVAKIIRNSNDKNEVGTTVVSIMNHLCVLETKQLAKQLKPLF